jgi:hypothetical protein
MKANRARVAGGVIAAFVIANEACELEELDAIGPPTSNGDLPADGSSRDRSLLSDAMASADVVDGSKGFLDGSKEKGEGGLDARTGADASKDAATDVSTPSSPACGKATAPVMQWTFDTAIESWISTPSKGATAPLTWTGSTGDPTDGALQVVYTPPSESVADSGTQDGVWLDVDINPSDLSKRTVSAEVWLDEGPSPQFRTFVQSETDYAWADNGLVVLPLRTWTCVSLPVSTPDFSQPEYDPTQVIRIGFEMLTNVPLRIYIDTVRVE